MAATYTFKQDYVFSRSKIEKKYHQIKVHAYYNGLFHTSYKLDIMIHSVDLSLFFILKHGKWSFVRTSIVLKKDFPWWKEDQWSLFTLGLTILLLIVKNYGYLLYIKLGLSLAGFCCVKYGLLLFVRQHCSRSVNFE